MSSETAIFRFSPVNSTVVFRTSTPDVPSKTYSMQELSLTPGSFLSDQTTNLHNSFTSANFQNLTGTPRSIREGKVYDL
jgi:hypothetical protein